MSSGNCGISLSEMDVPKMVGVTGGSVLTEIDASGNLDEELGVLDVLDLVKRDYFDRIGIASGSKDGFLAILRERWGKG